MKPAHHSSSMWTPSQKNKLRSSFFDDLSQIKEHKCIFHHGQVLKQEVLRLGAASLKVGSKAGFLTSFGRLLCQLSSSRHSSASDGRVRMGCVKRPNQAEAKVCGVGRFGSAGQHTFHSSTRRCRWESVNVESASETFVFVARGISITSVK